MAHLQSCSHPALKAWRIDQVARQLQNHPQIYVLNPTIFYAREEGHLYANVMFSHFCVRPDQPFIGRQAPHLACHGFEAACHITLCDTRDRFDGMPPELTPDCEIKINELLKPMFRQGMQFGAPVFLKDVFGKTFRVILFIDPASPLYVGLIEVANLLCRDLRMDPRGIVRYRELHVSVDSVHEPLGFCDDPAWLR